MFGNDLPNHRMENNPLCPLMHFPIKQIGLNITQNYYYIDVKGRSQVICNAFIIHTAIQYLTTSFFISRSGDLSMSDEGTNDDHSN